MLNRLVLILLLLLPAHMVAAQSDEKINRLAELLQLQPLFDIMREEGVTYGEDLDRDLLGGAGGISWQRTVLDIYEPNRVWQTFQPIFASELQGADVDAMNAFFESDTGRRIVGLEVEARRALLDKAIETASKEQYHALSETPSPRLELLDRLVEANDLVEFNVMGALNASYAFYTGMIDGRAFDTPPNEEDVLRDVWSQEGEIRLDTTEWLYSYMLLAYQPLSDDDLRAYIEFSDSKAGRALNKALFAAYDGVSLNVSKALGLSAAQFMHGEEL